MGAGDFLTLSIDGYTFGLGEWPFSYNFKEGFLLTENEDTYVFCMKPAK